MLHRRVARGRRRSRARGWTSSWRSPFKERGEGFARDADRRGESCHRSAERGGGDAEGGGPWREKRGEGYSRRDGPDDVAERRGQRDGEGRAGEPPPALRPGSPRAKRCRAPCATSLPLRAGCRARGDARGPAPSSSRRARAMRTAMKSRAARSRLKWPPTSWRRIVSVTLKRVTMLRASSACSIWVAVRSTDAGARSRRTTRYTADAPVGSTRFANVALVTYPIADGHALARDSQHP